jgi:predicted O-methyltransferase YrrM
MRSEGQSGAMAEYFGRRAREGTLDWKHMDGETHTFFRDKMVALEKDKAEYCYALCRALRATRVVEAGTSFGVSTLYLAAAVRDNGGGNVIGTEYEPSKAKIARANFAAAGLRDYTDYFDYIADPKNRLRTMTLPFAGGLEMTVRM